MEKEIIKHSNMHTIIQFYSPPDVVDIEEEKNFKSSYV